MASPGGMDGGEMVMAYEPRVGQAQFNYNHRGGSGGIPFPLPFDASTAICFQLLLISLIEIPNR